MLDLSQEKNHPLIICGCWALWQVSILQLFQICWWVRIFCFQKQSITLLFPSCPYHPFPLPCDGSLPSGPLCTATIQLFSLAYPFTYLPNSQSCLVLTSKSAISWSKLSSNLALLNSDYQFIRITSKHHKGFWSHSSAWFYPRINTLSWFLDIGKENAMGESKL